MYQKTVNEVIEIFNKVLKCEPKIQDDNVVIDDLDIESLEIFYILSEVESHFDIEIPDRRLKEMITIKDVAQIIEEILE